MAGESAYAKANECFVEENYEGALNFYTQALTHEPNNPSYLSRRAATHNKLEEYLEANEDATKAIKQDASSWFAYMQKGLALFNMDEFVTARQAFKAGFALSPDNRGFQTWIRKCESEMDEEDMIDVDTQAPATETSAPTQPTSTSNGTPAQSAEPTNAPPATTPTPASAPAAVPSATSALRIKHEWYQTDTHVVVGVLVKQAKREGVHVQVEPRALSVDIDLPTGTTYNLDLDLAGEVDPSDYRLDVLGTRVEIKMKKAAAFKWPALEGTQVKETPQDKERPSYPSSNKRGQRDWDMLVAELKQEEKDEKLEGDQAVNKLFQQIYANADEDTRRAMNKSFVESGGTVLSTNWKDVGAKKIEVQAPEGMEPKEYEK